ncbi:MAG: sn-glycerol-3-phosphate ABC transporter ATP-binding protein UgpC [Myxococcales bacterium]|nr:sn-glycerol-3-phosphate ABC transporter ATP-binding protein UgpC [Myxococcota bacterium]MDW8280143.1 sn-glycerol-3-phosphate ABC transporter ATP-binding protein UgpC [Myxococcales bacterium]
MASVTLRQISKDKPTGQGRGRQLHRILDDVSLDIPDGELVVLVGPSGCGKTTLLRCIAGLEEPDSGTIAIDGRVVNGVEPRDRDIAMVFQSYALYPHMTVRDNLAFGLRMRRTPADEIERRIAEAAAMLEIEALLGRYPRELSGGQRQRVAMGRAVVRRPRVFLFDEPLSNLDAALRQQMRVELLRLHRRLGTTMIYVTHDQVEAMTLAQRIVVMNRGRLEQVGPPQALYHRPANVFVARFLGTPEMNLLPGRIDGGRFMDPDSGVSLAAEGLPAGEALLGLRAEDISLTPAGQVGTVPARVDLVELLGWEGLVHLRLGPRVLVARCEAACAPSPGTVVGLRIQPGRGHLFAVPEGHRLGL